MLNYWDLLVLSRNALHAENFLSHKDTHLFSIRKQQEGSLCTALWGLRHKDETEGREPNSSPWLPSSEKLRRHWELIRTSEESGWAGSFRVAFSGTFQEAAFQHNRSPEFLPGFLL